LGERHSGYGPNGPSVLRPAVHPIPGAVCGDALMQVGEGWPREGVESLAGLHEASRQSYCANEANPDPNTSAVVLAATALALHARRRTGQGQQVFVSMLCANGYANWDHFLARQGNQSAHASTPGCTAPGPCTGSSSAGGLRVCRSVSEDGQADARWAALCQAAGRPELATDLHFRDAEARTQHRDELTEVLEALFATRDADAWKHLLIAAGVGCVHADSYGNAGQFFLRDPHMHANGFTPVVRGAALGEYQRWGPHVAFSETPERSGPGVLAGEHAEAILAELGHESEESAELHRRGIIQSYGRYEPDP